MSWRVEHVLYILSARIAKRSCGHATGDGACQHASCVHSQGFKIEVPVEAFWHWLASSAAALPLALWDAAAAQKLPTETLAAADAEREAHCRQAFSMVSGTDK
jgi:hypothetical protein